MSHRRSKTCPNCGGDAVNHPSPGDDHASHAMHAARHTGSPLIMGLTIFSSALAGYRSHRFTCGVCKHKFFGW